MKDFSSVGIVFISPIIGITPSMLATFGPLVDRGATVEGVDIFEGYYGKKTLWKLLRLTFLPKSHEYRIRFANALDEDIIFKKINSVTNRFIDDGKKIIIIGGMSGGFIFASRMVELSHHPFIRGIFGISPLIFYPPEVKQHGATLEHIPTNVSTLFIWGDKDDIIPEGTIDHAQMVSHKSSHLTCLVIPGAKHQFFGGPDFRKPLKNIFWNRNAEQFALATLTKFIEGISS